MCDGQVRCVSRPMRHLKLQLITGALGFRKPLLANYPPVTMSLQVKKGAKVSDN